MIRVLILVLTITIAGRSSDDPIQSGPMLGYAEKREVFIWIQTKRPAPVQIRYFKQGEPKTQTTTRPVATLEDRDCIAHVVINALTPGSTYVYDVLVDGKTARKGLTFKTQPLWEWRTDPPNFTIAIGSCAYVNDPEFDRPGTPYGSDYQIFRIMTDQKPDAMVWMGDNVYLREVDWNTRKGMMYRYRHSRSLPELQPFLAACPQYAVWDDHDYGPNDSDRGFIHKDLSLDVFKLYWGNPAYGMTSLPGVFFQFTWGDVDFFMTDDRFYRAPQRQKDGPDKPLLGREQLQWLKDALLFSRAPFKIVVCGSQVLNRHTNHESYNLHSTERDDLLQFIREYKVPGVFFISGDVHFSEMNKQEDAGFYPFYDYSSSSLTAGLFEGASKIDNPMRIKESLVFDKHSFGLLKFSGTRKDRRMTVETVDVDGNVRWTFSIHQNDLSVKEKKAE